MDNRQRRLTKRERCKLYRSKLNEIRGKKDTSVTFFNKETEMALVIGAREGEDKFIANYPRHQTRDQDFILETDFPRFFEKYEHAFNWGCGLEEAINLTEDFFREVCSLPEDYTVTVTVTAGKVECFICGEKCPLSEMEDNFIEIYPDEARKLGVPEEKISEERRFAEEAFEAARPKDSPLFPPICSKCIKKLRIIRKNLKPKNRRHR